MRGLMLASSLFTLLLVPRDVYTYPLPHTPASSLTEYRRDTSYQELERREVNCNVGNLGTVLRTAKASDCIATNSFKFDDPKLKRGTKLANIPLAVAVNTKPTKPTCDHILELNILKTVMEQDGGVCASMQGLDEQQQKAKIEGLRKIINDGNTNLAFFSATAESKKTALVDAFQKNLPPPDVDPFQMLAAIDYIEKTSAKSTAVARDLDAEIAANFEGANGGVEAEWDRFLTFARTNKVIYTQKAEKKLQKLEQKAQQQQQRAAQCGQTSSSGTQPPAPPPPPALVRRQARQAPLGTPGARRNKGAAPSCPAPGATPKKKVPRNSLTAKPAPNRRIASPSRPATQPRPPPAKKTVPRPANRPRRQPGTPKPQPKRTTPKRKPKQVPKRPNRPRGNPRRRRG